MRKIILLLMFFIISASPAFAAGDESLNISDSFRAYCKTEMNKVVETYKGDQYSIVYKNAGNKQEHWNKSSDNVESAYGVEIQKAEIPGEPDTGILIVKCSTTIYADNYDSEEAAKKDTEVIRNVKSVYKFYMSYENKQWVLTKVLQYTHWQKKWHTVPPTSIFEILQSKNEIKQ